MAVCSEIHTKHINTLCGQNVELLNVKLAVYIVTTGGTYSDHWDLRAKLSSYNLQTCWNAFQSQPPLPYEIHIAITATATTYIGKNNGYIV